MLHSVCQAPLLDVDESGVSDAAKIESISAYPRKNHSGAGISSS